jgi:hypothetical protein
MSDPNLSIYHGIQENNAEGVVGAIRAGADVNRRHDAVFSPLHFAVDHGFADMVILLLRHGADVDIALGAGGITPFHFACANFAERSDADPRIICILLAAGADMGDLSFEPRPGKACLAIPERDVVSTGLTLVRQRCFEICVGLQDLALPAPLLIELAVESCEPFARHLPFHLLWALVCTVKHWRQRSVN